MFGKLRMHGAGDGAAIVWGGYRTAVRLRTWRIGKVSKSIRIQAGVPTMGDQVWTLNGRIEASPDQFVARQTPLLLAVPRAGGFWTWPVVGPLRIENGIVVATLGQPLQG